MNECHQQIDAFVEIFAHGGERMRFCRGPGKCIQPDRETRDGHCEDCLVERRGEGYKEIRARIRRGDGFAYVDALVWLCAIAAVVGAAAWAIGAWHSFVAGIDQAGYDRGVATTKAEVAERDNRALRAAEARAKDLQQAARDEERRRAGEMANIGQAYQEQLDHAKEQTGRALDQLRAGALRLRDPAAGAACSAGGAAGQAGGTGSGGDGAARGELSASASRFLLELTGEADERVEQLAACQAVVKKDRQ